MKKTRSRREILTTGGTLLLAGLLAGCREAEQGRLLRYDKGTYLGPEDEALKDDDLTTLKQRAAHQRM